MYKNFFLVVVGVIGLFIAGFLFLSGNFISSIAIWIASAGIIPFKQNKKMGVKEKSIAVTFLIVIAVIFLKAPEPTVKKEVITRHERVVTKKEFKDKWPLTVDNAVIACIKDSVGKEPLVIIHGEPYGLAGFADAQYGQNNIQALDKYLAKNPNFKGLHKDLGAITDEALKLCK